MLDQCYFGTAVEPGCFECERLRLAVEETTHRHLNIVNRFQSATINGEADIVPALEAAMREAASNRENATDAYRFHIAAHTLSVAGGAA
jgi:hypothetical protein